MRWGVGFLQTDNICLALSAKESVQFAPGGIVTDPPAVKGANRQSGNVHHKEGMGLTIARKRGGLGGELIARRGRTMSLRDDDLRVEVGEGGAAAADGAARTIGGVTPQAGVIASFIGVLRVPEGTVVDGPVLLRRGAGLHAFDFLLGVLRVLLVLVDGRVPGKVLGRGSGGAGRREGFGPGVLALSLGVLGRASVLALSRGRGRLGHGGGNGGLL